MEVSKYERLELDVWLRGLSELQKARENVFKKPMKFKSMSCLWLWYYNNIPKYWNIFPAFREKKKNLKPIILFHESHFFSQKRGWTLNRQLRKAYCQAEAARLLRVRVLGLRLGPRPLLLSHLTADPQYEPEIIKILLFLFHPSCALYCKSVTLGTH